MSGAQAVNLAGGEPLAVPAWGDVMASACLVRVESVAILAVAAGAKSPVVWSRELEGGCVNRHTRLMPGVARLWMVGAGR